MVSELEEAIDIVDDSLRRCVTAREERSHSVGFRRSGGARRVREQTIGLAHPQLDLREQLAHRDVRILFRLRGQL